MKSPVSVLASTSFMYPNSLFELWLIAHPSAMPVLLVYQACCFQHHVGTLSNHCSNSWVTCILCQKAVAEVHASSCHAYSGSSFSKISTCQSYDLGLHFLGGICCRISGSSGIHQAWTQPCCFLLAHSSVARWWYTCYLASWSFFVWFHDLPELLH